MKPVLHIVRQIHSPPVQRIYGFLPPHIRILGFRFPQKPGLPQIPHHADPNHVAIARREEDIRNTLARIIARQLCRQKS